MNLQAHQRALLERMPVGYLEKLAEAGPASTAVIGERVLACAGVAYLGWIGTLWAFVAQDAGAHFISLHREIRRCLMESPVRRIEATVEADFEPGIRWLRLLNFENEGLMRAYGPHGEDHYRFARIY
jgi:hypothetical protein